MDLSSRPIRQAVYLLVIAAVALAVVVPASAIGAQLTWSSPETVDLQPDLHGPRAVSCPTATLCVAVDGVGNVLTSTAPTAAAWRIVDIDGSNELNGLSCPTSTFCAAVDGAGNVLTSSDPTGGADAWQPTDVDGTNFIERISCPTSGFCAASDFLGNVLTSSDPTGGADRWTATRLDQEDEPLGALGSISCASSSLCVAGSDYDFGDSLFASSDPTGGAAAWLPAEVGVASIDCPTTTFCVAGGFDENVLTSTDPTAGTAAWSSAPLDLGGDFLSTVSCPSTALCLGGTNGGRVVTSVDPTGGASSWNVEELDNVRFLDMSCIGTPMCVAFDSLGRVLVGTAGTGRRLTIAVHGIGFVEVGDDGFSCRASCSRVYPDGASITLSASSVRGSGEQFAGWSGGGCSGTGPCEVRLDADTSVTASFTPESSEGGEEPGDGSPGGGEQGGEQQEQAGDQPGGGEPSGGGGTVGPGPSASSSSSGSPAATQPVRAPASTSPKRCRKGFKQKRVRGKRKCVKVHKAQKHTKLRGKKP